MPQDDGSGVNNIEGNDLPFAPPVTFTIAYQHDFLLSNGALIRPFVKFHWEDEMHFTEGNFDAIPALSDKRDSIGTVDATLRFESPSGTWVAEAFVYNATDERFQTYWVDANQPDAPLFTWNAPRTYGLRMSYNFSP